MTNYVEMEMTELNIKIGIALSILILNVYVSQNQKFAITELNTVNFTF